MRRQQATRPVESPEWREWRQQEQRTRRAYGKRRWNATVAFDRWIERYRYQLYYEDLAAIASERFRDGRLVARRSARSVLRVQGGGG